MRHCPIFDKGGAGLANPDVYLAEFIGCNGVSNALNMQCRENADTVCCPRTWDITQDEVLQARHVSPAAYPILKSGQIQDASF